MFGRSIGRGGGEEETGMQIIRPGDYYPFAMEIRELNI